MYTNAGTSGSNTLSKKLSRSFVEGVATPDQALICHASMISLHCCLLFCSIREPNVRIKTISLEELFEYQ